MRSRATARDTVLFTVPRLMPSVAAISGSVTIARRTYASSAARSLILLHDR